jgi:hypothetical protein
MEGLSHLKSLKKLAVILYKRGTSNVQTDSPPFHYIPSKPNSSLELSLLAFHCCKRLRANFWTVTSILM